MMTVQIMQLIVQYMQARPGQSFTGQEVYDEVVPAFREDAIAFAMGCLWAEQRLLCVRADVSFEIAEWRLV